MGGTEKAGPAEIWEPGSTSFSQAAAKPSIRSSHTATSLPDGSVLVVGGFGRKAKRLDTAEVWDAVTASPVASSVMSEGRAAHAAALLGDGRVLVMGGTGDALALASVEAWDPVTGAFSTMSPMTGARAYHTATPLRDGRVLVTGGVDEQWDALGTAEVWDPATEAFSATGPMARPRGWHVAVLLGDGRVLIAGGIDYEGGMHALADAEIWDPASGTFTPTGPMGVERYAFTGTLLQDGRVLMAAGWTVGTGDLVHDTTELWDPATGSFTPAATMLEARMFHSATLLPDGRVLMVGGWRSHNTDGLAEVFDPGS